MTLPLPAQPRRIVYVGTPAMAVAPLEAIIQAGFSIVHVITRADARRTRRGEPEPSPVKQAALTHGIAVSHDINDALEVDADLGIVVAYGRIIPDSVLERLPMVNLHFSLLPRWRGAAPVERALLAGDRETGVCLMDVTHGLDEGDIYATTRVPIDDSSTLESLRIALVDAGGELLISGLTNGFGAPQSQIGDAIYAQKITQDDRRIDWTQPAGRIARTISIGDAWTVFRSKRIKIWQSNTAQPSSARHIADKAGELVAPQSDSGPWVATGSGLMELTVVQPEGKARMSAAAWANGARLSDHDCFDT